MNILAKIKELIDQANAAPVTNSGQSLSGQGPLGYLGTFTSGMSGAFAPSVEQDKRIATEAGHSMTLGANPLMPAETVVRKVAETLKSYDFKIESAKPITAKGGTPEKEEKPEGYEALVRHGGSITKLHLWPDWVEAVAHEREAEYDGFARNYDLDLFMVNETKINSKGQVQLAPYGDWPHVRGLQRFQKSDAQCIVNEFNRWKRSPLNVMGLPFYIGHPDHPEYANIYTDHKAVGRVKSMEAGEDGLYADVKWNRYGRDLIEGECFHGHSVNWKTRFFANDSTASNVRRPFYLKSIGFTNENNLPVIPVTQANEKKETQDMDIKILRESLALAETATDADVLNAIKVNREAFAANEATTKEQARLKTLNETLTPQVETLTNEKNALTAEKITLTAKIGTLSAEKQSAVDSLANERKARAKDKTEELLRLGKITKAEMATVETELCNSFEPTMAKYQAKKATLHTEQANVTKDLGGKNSAMKLRTSEGMKRQDQVLNLVNEKMTKIRAVNGVLSGEDLYNKAFTDIRNEHPELFQTNEETHN